MIENNGNWGMLAGMQDQEQQMSHRDVIWVCPYCGNEVGHEPPRPCCGEYGHEIAVDIDTGEPIENK